MERLDEPTTPRARPEAARWEIAVVVAVVLTGWRVLLGWDWAVAQTTFEWVAFGLVALLGVGWLARRGRGAAGTVAVTVPVILLSGWRLAASGVTGWPVGLASLIDLLERGDVRRDHQVHRWYSSHRRALRCNRTIQS